MMVRIGLVLLGLCLCAWRFGSATLAAETIRTNGEEILFELAPVDPRALLLGDYMTLRYDFGLEDLSEDAKAAMVGRTEDDSRLKGTAVIRLTDGVARFDRFLDPKQPEDLNALEADERLIRYRRTGRMWQPITIGGEAYYFQSGTGERFVDAEYGIFRVMPDGRALLSGLADKEKRPILIAGEAPISSSTR